MLREEGNSIAKLPSIMLSGLHSNSSVAFPLDDNAAFELTVDVGTRNNSKLCKKLISMELLVQIFVTECGHNDRVDIDDSKNSHDRLP